jgi:hypothetical protein
MKTRAAGQGRRGGGFMRATLNFALGCALGLAGCRSLPIYSGQQDELQPKDPSYAETVQVRYLGVGGYLIRLGAEAVMTGPLYSNPGLAPEVLGRMHPKERLIRRFHPRQDYPAQVRGTLVGHAHYDHLMDVPYVRAWFAPKAAIYGNHEVTKLLQLYNGGQAPKGFPTPLPKLMPGVDLIDVMDQVDGRMCAGAAPSDEPAPHRCERYVDQAGAWIMLPGERIRVRALCSRHSPQFAGYHQAPGCLENAPTELPQRNGDYREGHPLAYLIDFLDAKGAPIYRIYYADAARDGDFGAVHPELLQERLVDLALLCASNTYTVDGPGNVDLVRHLQPRAVVLGHWENFFLHQGKRLEPAPLQRIKAGRAYRGVEYELSRLPCPCPRVVYLPRPQQVLRFSLK